MADLVTFMPAYQDHGGAGACSLATVRMWIARGRLPNRMGVRNFDRDWDVRVDEDGAFCLLPRHTAEPPFAILTAADGFVVLVCDTDDMEELGPFPHVEAALRGIQAWLGSPERLVS